MLLLIRNSIHTSMQARCVYEEALVSVTNSSPAFVLSVSAFLQLSVENCPFQPDGLSHIGQEIGIIASTINEAAGDACHWNIGEHAAGRFGRLQKRSQARNSRKELPSRTVMVSKRTTQTCLQSCCHIRASFDAVWWRKKNSVCVQPCRSPVDVYLRSRPTHQYWLKVAGKAPPCW